MHPRRRGPFQRSKQVEEEIAPYFCLKTRASIRQKVACSACADAPGVELPCCRMVTRHVAYEIWKAQTLEGKFFNSNRLEMHREIKTSRLQGVVIHASQIL